MKKIVVLILSIVLVLAIIGSSTYSLLFEEKETEEQNFTVGTLSVTSNAVNNSVVLTNSLPMDDIDGAVSTPYVFKLINSGNLNYTFDIKLLSTITDESVEQINSQYIKIKINEDEPVRLSSLTDSILLSNVTLGAAETRDITLRIWLDESTPNSEIGKVFSAKIVTNGYAEYTDPSLLPKSVQTLINLGLTLNDDVPDFTKTSCSSGCEESTVGIYSTQDDLGTSYYFRGDVENNYVKFGKWKSDWSLNGTKMASAGEDMYWRIIRINGDGSIRLIYDGNKIRDNGIWSDYRTIGTSSFYNLAHDNTFVGYMFGVEGVSDYASTHSNLFDSIVKTLLEDEWYTQNFAGTEYESHIVDAIYCNDRSVSHNVTGYNGNGTSTSNSAYMAVERLHANKNPSLICGQSNDRFTADNLNFDIETNGMLDAPVGLITADEFAFAGAVYGKTNNKQFYLYVGNDYWTMTPFSYYGTKSNMFITNYSTNYFSSPAGNARVRPVISISGDAIKSGDGTKNNPFVVE